MKHIEKTVFMNMCMVYDGDKVVVQNRLSDDWRGVALWNLESTLLMQ